MRECNIEVNLFGIELCFDCYLRRVKLKVTAIICVHLNTVTALKLKGSSPSFAKILLYNNITQPASTPSGLS